MLKTDLTYVLKALISLLYYIQVIGRAQGSVSDVEAGPLVMPVLWLPGLNPRRGQGLRPLTAVLGEEMVPSHQCFEMLLWVLSDAGSPSRAVCPSGWKRQEGTQ